MTPLRWFEVNFAETQLNLAYKLKAFNVMKDVALASTDQAVIDATSLKAKQTTVDRAKRHKKGSFVDDSTVAKVIRARPPVESKRYLPLTGMDDPGSLILILWCMWMSSDCSFGY